MAGKRLDPDVRQLAETMQRRRDEARKRVADGEIPHLRFMSEDQIREAAAHNLCSIAPGAEGNLRQLADAAVYGLALIAKRSEE